jgi:hypothetical protein
MKRPPKPVRAIRKGPIHLPEPERLTAAEAATYVGSPEHKLPGARSDASLCPPNLDGSQELLTQWLREALRVGLIGGPMEGRFPRYVWYRHADDWFAGRLTNQTLGQYKGYPISVEEVPTELRDDEGLDA